MKASIIFYPRESKMNSRTRKIPVYMRVCFNREKSESRLNLELSQTEILKWDPITLRLQERNSPINHCLNRLDQKFQEFIHQNITKLPEFSASYIRDYILGKDKSQKKSVLNFADDYFINSVANNINRSPGTIKNYRRSINHLRNFLASRKQETLVFDQLNFDFAQDFKNYLVSSDTAKNRIGMTEVSASGVIKKFRTIFSDAVDRELLLKNPFKLLKIKTKSPKRERLTINQVRDILEIDLSCYPGKEVYRDIFLFSVFTGLAYKDAMGLNWSNLEKREPGNIKLSVRRIKSDVITESFLPEQALEILKKYIDCPNGKGALPYRSNKEINSQLKFLASIAKIPIPLSTHIARHTFRQLLAEAGIEDYGVIKRMMGQSRNGDVDEVYYSITEKKLLEAKNRFQLLLTNELPLLKQ